MRSILPYSRNISFKGALEAALPTVDKSAFKASEEKAVQETLFNQNVATNDCFFVAVLKSIMFSLNEYARKNNNPSYNAASWLDKFVVTDKENNAEICFPLSQNIPNKVKVSLSPEDKFVLSKGNAKIPFLEKAYGLLSKTIDKCRAKSHDFQESLNSGWSFLAIHDLTGLRSLRLTQSEGFTGQKELFKEYTGKLFHEFKEHPENLIITLDAKRSVPDFWYDYSHTFSLKKVVDDGLIVVDPLKTEEIKISFDNFYKHFKAVNFARMQPEKMFNMIENAKNTTSKELDSHVYDPKASTNPIRDTNNYSVKNLVYFDVPEHKP